MRAKIVVLVNKKFLWLVRLNSLDLPFISDIIYLRQKHSVPPFRLLKAMIFVELNGKKGG
jgi:hypothetical protein